jgi:hypothetical protein
MPLNAKTLLPGIRVASADELKAQIEPYLKQVNETPVVFVGSTNWRPVSGLVIDLLFKDHCTNFRKG